MATLRDLVESGRSLNKRDDLNSYLERLSHRIGCDAAWLSFTCGINERVRNTSRPRVAVAFNLDEDERSGWLLSPELDDCDAPLSYAHDPIRREMCDRSTPLFWNILPAFAVNESIIKCNDEEERWLEHKRMIGVQAGLSIPIHLHNGCQGSITLIREQQPDRLHRELDDCAAEMFFGAHVLFEAWMKNLDWLPKREEPQIPLTPREKECLFWSARGKTASETAQILGISVGTCRKYLQVSLEKLNVTSKAAAIAKLSTGGADWL